VKEERSDLREVASVALGYVKQETFGPLKKVGKLLAFGTAGSVFMAVGTILIGVGLLRLLQMETGSSFTGHLSWLPYGITVVFYLIVAAVVAARIGKRRG